jgi:hypothetical protein
LKAKIKSKNQKQKYLKAKMKAKLFSRRVYWTRAEGEQKRRRQVGQGIGSRAEEGQDMHSTS